MALARVVNTIPSWTYQANVNNGDILIVIKRAPNSSHIFKTLDGQILELEPFLKEDGTGCGSGQKRVEFL